MRATEVAEIITAAGLNPADYRTARAAAILTTWAEGAAEDGETGPTVADLWETLGGNQDETVPRSDEAADAAWEVADSLTGAVDFGGRWAA